MRDWLWSWSHLPQVRLGSDRCARNVGLAVDSAAAALSACPCDAAASTCGGRLCRDNRARDFGDGRGFTGAQAQGCATRHARRRTGRSSDSRPAAAESPGPLGATVGKVLDTSLIPGRSIEPIDLANALRLAGVRELDIAIAPPARQRIDRGPASTPGPSGCPAFFWGRRGIGPTDRCKR